MKKKKNARNILLCALAVLVIAHLVFFFASPSHKNTCMIAHRGYSFKYYENTESAFIGAGEHGSGGAETDVRITKDGVLVCSHGNTVDFKDGTSLKIDEATYEELTAKPLDTKKGEVYLCTFRRYLEVCKEYNLICFIELKGEFPDDKLRECFQMASDVYDIKMCELQSFAVENLLKTKEMFPELKCMLTYGKGDDIDYKQVCFDNGFDIDMEFNTCSKAIVDEFHAHGLTVGVWTVNEIYVLGYCRWMQPDYIESDIF